MLVINRGSTTLGKNTQKLDHSRLALKFYVEFRTQLCTHFLNNIIYQSTYVEFCRLQTTVFRRFGGVEDTKQKVERVINWLD